MDTDQAVQALGALAHEHRLAIYRLLVERGPEGLPAGAIGEGVGPKGAVPGEVCPIWPGKPITAHWGIEDPAAVEDTNERSRAFRKAAAELEARIKLLISLPAR